MLQNTQNYCGSAGADRREMGLHILCVHFRAVIQQQPGQLIVAPGGSCVERGCLLHWHCAVFLASAAELPKLGESHGGCMGNGME
jgi:hypothetical protein